MVTLLLFVVVLGREGDWALVAVVVGVLTLHELGHLFAMHRFGFRHLRMLFVPGFGAAVTGRKHGASANEHAWILLLGPLPGVVLGTVLAGWVAPGSFDAEAMPVFTQVVVVLLALNLGNLLPAPVLDGGRFFEVLLVARWPKLHLAVRLALASMAAALAFVLQAPVLGVLAALALVASPHASRIAAEASALRRLGTWSGGVDARSDAELEALYDAAFRLLPRGAHVARNKRQALRQVPMLFDHVAREPATARELRVLLGAWSATLLIVGVGIALLLVRGA